MAAVHGKLTLAMIEQRFTAAEDRERRLRDFYSPTPTFESPSLWDETAEQSELDKIPMPALTNFGMGFNPTHNDTSGKMPLMRNGHAIKHRFADHIEAPVELEPELLDEDDEDAIAASSTELGASASRLSTVSQDFGFRAVSPELSIRAQTPDGAALERQVLDHLNSDLERRSAVLMAQMEGSLKVVDEKPLFDQPPPEGKTRTAKDAAAAHAAQAGSLEHTAEARAESAARASLREQLMNQMEASSKRAGSSALALTGSRSGSPERGFSPARSASRLSMGPMADDGRYTAGVVPSDAGSTGGDNPVRQALSVIGGSSCSSIQGFAPSRSKQTMAAPKNISLKFRPPPKPDPVPWPKEKPQHGRRSQQPPPDLDDPASYGLRVTLSAQTATGWPRFVLTITDVSDDARPSVSWCGLPAGRVGKAGHALLVPCPAADGLSYADRAFGPTFWPIAMLPWLDRPAQLRDHGLRLEVWADLASPGKDAARAKVVIFGDATRAAAMDAVGPKLLDCAVYYTQRELAKGPNRWEKTCPRPAVAPPPAAAACVAPGMALVTRTMLETVLPPPAAVRRQRQRVLTTSEKQFRSQQEMSIVGQPDGPAPQPAGRAIGARVGSTSPAEFSGLIERVVTPEQQQGHRRTSFRHQGRRSMAISPQRSPPSVPDGYIAVGSEIAKAAEMGLVGGSFHVESRPMTPDQWATVNPTQSPPPSASHVPRTADASG